MLEFALAGVLMRICQVFARRGFNIDSLVVSNGRDARFSRMTIGISGSPGGLEQIIHLAAPTAVILGFRHHVLIAQPVEKAGQAGAATQEIRGQGGQVNQGRVE